MRQASATPLRCARLPADILPAPAVAEMVSAAAHAREKPMSEPVETPPIATIPVCQLCASARVLINAWGTWSTKQQRWELQATGATGYCPDCTAETHRFDWVSPEEQTKRRVRHLNDQLRQGDPGPHDLIVATRGIAALGEAFMMEVGARLRTFAAFDVDNDPHEEHDFGAFRVEGEQLYFKIDYYNLTRDGYSSDPADPAVTSRVLTIMLASEY